MTRDPTESTDDTESSTRPTLSSDALPSRRGFLAGSAAVGGGALGLSTFGSSVVAQSSEETATVSMADQMSNGLTVVVESTTLPEGGFVAIHDERLLEGKAVESVVGVSADLDAGSHENVQVTLFDVPGAEFDQPMLMEDQSLIAMPHMDTNDNNSYDFVATGGEQDGPYVDGGSAVTDSAMITVDGDTTTDLEVLNYALTLEHLEATFYAKGLEDFSDKEFRTADLACDTLCPELRDQIPEQIRVVGDHESAHVDTLVSTIESIGGDPVEAAEYDFGYETASEFLELAMTLENTGVGAYAGVAPTIAEDAYLAAALSIHSVEARHAAMFNLINGVSPFPTAFDEALSMETVIDAIAPLIVSNG